MRTIILVVALAACGGAKGGGGGGSRPGVMPLLSELPGDPEKRDAILDQSNQTATPESRKTMTKKERKAETDAATAAAIIGGLFSKTQNVTFGGATLFDETRSERRKPKTQPVDGEDAKDPKDPNAEPEPPVTVPWIKLK